MKRMLSFEAKCPFFSFSFFFLCVCVLIINVLDENFGSRLTFRKAFFFCTAVFFVPTRKSGIIT